MTATARAGDVRVQVATIDGAPVYHWRAFNSSLADDVDRALIVREFHRKDFKIPSKLVDDGVKRQVIDQFGGNNDRFAHHLHEEGVTLADFRAFVTEEIIVNAMLYQEARTAAESAQLQAKFLERLRAGAVVKRFAAKGKTANG